MNFKDIIKADVKDVFLNTEEFSDMHIVNGVPMAVQIDDIEQIEREKRYNQNMDGIFVSQKLIYVSAEEWGNSPSLAYCDRQFKSKCLITLRLAFNHSILHLNNKDSPKLVGESCSLLISI